MVRKPSVVVSPIRTVLVIAAAAIALHLGGLWLTGGGVPAAYELGRLFGVHLVAAIVTALIASFTRVGSTGALVAVYVLAFVAAQILTVLTNLT